jgi:uncharacterized protein YcfL
MKKYFLYLLVICSFINCSSDDELRSFELLTSKRWVFDSYQLLKVTSNPGNHSDSKIQDQIISQYKNKVSYNFSKDYTADFFDGYYGYSIKWELVNNQLKLDFGARPSFNTTFTIRAIESDQLVLYHEKSATVIDGDQTEYAGNSIFVVKP